MMNFFQNGLGTLDQLLFFQELIFAQLELSLVVMLMVRDERWAETILCLEPRSHLLIRGSLVELQNTKRQVPPTLWYSVTSEN